MTDAMFWSKVNKTDGCWQWTAYTDARGYGIVSIDGNNHRAHRVAWEMTQGPIPATACVLHHCDNPSCVNPSHLFVGTQYDNVRDCAAKGRRASRKGASHSRVLLSDGKARLIRAMRRSGFTVKGLAAIFSVSHKCIEMVIYNRSWTHV